MSCWGPMIMPSCPMKIFHVLLRPGSLELGIWSNWRHTSGSSPDPFSPGTSSSSESLLQTPPGNWPSALVLKSCLDSPLLQQWSKVGQAGTPTRSLHGIALKSGWKDLESQVCARLFLNSFERQTSVEQCSEGTLLAPKEFHLTPQPHASKCQVKTTGAFSEQTQLWMCVDMRRSARG